MMWLHRPGGHGGDVRPAGVSQRNGDRLLPRRFALVRHVDYTGVSGVGVVAYGVVFADGHVALRWASTHPATSLWGSMDDLVAVHGHGEATSIEWLDPDSDPFAQPAVSRGAGRRARRVQPDPVLPEPVVEPDVTRPTRPIVIDPPPARPDAVRPEPGRREAVRPDLLGADLPHPEPLQPRSARPEPAASAAPPPPPPAEPSAVEPPRAEPSAVEPRRAEPAAVEPPPEPRPAEPSPVQPPPEPRPAEPRHAEAAGANGVRPAHPRLPAQRGAGRHRRAAAEPPSRTTYQIESDGS